MNDYFIWNGVRSTDYGIHVTEQPPITLPAERSTQTNVPGRPGSLTTLEGEDVYDDLLLTCTCFIQDMSRINEIGRWLRGAGTVVFPVRPGGYYKARIANQISFERILRGNPHCSFSVNFRCSPFWYDERPYSYTFSSSGLILHNPGSVYAEPKIIVFGTGSITLMIGMTIVELEGITDSITIDCDLKEAYKGTTLMNEHMNGDFPVLKPGANPVSWVGNVSRVEIIPKWRYL